MESEANSEPIETPLPKRRWFQYTTRALLVVVTLLGVMLGVARWRLERQRESVEAIESRGGRVTYETTETRDVFPWWWLRLEWFESVTEVEFIYGATDEDLANLRGLNGLQVVTIRGGCVTSSGLEHLKSLPALRHLVFVEFWRHPQIGLAKLQSAVPGCQVSTD